MEKNAISKVLEPSNPIQKILAARRRGRFGSHSPARKPPNIKLSLSSSPEADNKRKGDNVLLAGKEDTLIQCPFTLGHDLEIQLYNAQNSRSSLSFSLSEGSLLYL
ncbi:hypothetical protein ACOSQ4_007881 [Xanthoceras sorbifolium]